MNTENPKALKAGKPEGEGTAPHPDDVAVDRFAAAMKDKLAQARAKGRGGWDDPAQCSVETLARMLVEHVAKGDPRDVANFAMMLHERGADRYTLARAALAAQQPAASAEQTPPTTPEQCAAELKLLSASIPPGYALVPLELVPRCCKTCEHDGGEQDASPCNACMGWVHGIEAVCWQQKKPAAAPAAPAASGVLSEADRAEALRLARTFDARTELAHDIIDAADLLGRIAAAPAMTAAGGEQDTDTACTRSYRDGLQNGYRLAHGGSEGEAQYQAALRTLTADITQARRPAGTTGGAQQSQAHAAAQAQPDTCRWTLGAGDSVWQTACGAAFSFETEGPHENGFDFCHSCGKPLSIVRECDEDETSDGGAAGATGEQA